jgi:uncharacterized protein (TIGR02246 family)
MGNKIRMLSRMRAAAGAVAISAIVLSGWACAALAGPKEEAQAVAGKFIAAFVAGDLEAAAALYSPDAIFWGTVSPELGTSPEVLRKYFADNYAARAKVPLISASITDSSALVLSDDTVVVAGRWQTERPSALSLLRFTMVMHKRDGQWRIVHLHSSPRPKQ